MKQLIIGFAVTMALVISLVAYANVYTHECIGHNYESLSVPFRMEGKHCNGIVGCDCPDFSPKTNGKEWEKDYCKHKKSSHK